METDTVIYSGYVYNVQGAAPLCIVRCSLFKMLVNYHNPYVSQKVQDINLKYKS